MSGLFFEKRAAVVGGRFFRDQAGREDGHFFRASRFEDAAPEAAVAREKVAELDPTTFDQEPIATGYHRPAIRQPEPLEAGGERFHASDAGPGASGGHFFGNRPALRKQAAAPPRFLGTAYEQVPLAKAAFSLPTGKDVGDAYDRARDAGESALESGKELGRKAWGKARQIGDQALDTLKGTGSGLGDEAVTALDAASKHPLGAAALVGGAGYLGAKALGGTARGVASVFRRKKPPPKGLVERGLQGLRRLVHR